MTVPSQAAEEGLFIPINIPSYTDPSQTFQSNIIAPSQISQSNTLSPPPPPASAAGESLAIPSVPVSLVPEAPTAVTKVVAVRTPHTGDYTPRSISKWNNNNYTNNNNGSSSNKPIRSVQFADAHTEEGEGGRVRRRRSGEKGGE